MYFDQILAFREALYRVSQGVEHIDHECFKKIFVTGPLREEYFLGTLPERVASDLESEAFWQGFVLEYLSPEREISLGFQALQNSISALRLVIYGESAQSLEEGFRFIAIQSGSTTAQVAVIQVGADEELKVEEASAFTIKTDLPALVEWICTKTEGISSQPRLSEQVDHRGCRLVIDSGSPSYTLVPGVRIACSKSTFSEEILTEVEVEAQAESAMEKAYNNGADERTVMKAGDDHRAKTGGARAYAIYMLEAMSRADIDYRLVTRDTQKYQEYKLESSPALGDPECVVDWGGGQMQNPRTGKKEPLNR